MRDDVSVSAIVAGLIAVIVSYAGPLVLVIQAAQAAHLSAAQLGSWIWAISVGAGVTALGLSLRTRTPVITAWSTPGAALLVAALPGVTPAQAVGAYLLSATVITAFGALGGFERLMHRVPRAMAAALLAGILFKFGIEVAGAAQTQPLLVGAMFLLYVVLRRVAPRYAIALVLLGGSTLASCLGILSWPTLTWTPTVPVLTMPVFDPSTLLSLGLPLCLVALTGQFVPGLAVMRTAGYTTPADPLVRASGLASLLMAPFGAHGINLAAITAAICTGREAHEDPAKRYMAGVACGVFYLLIGVFGTTLAVLFAALPQELVAAVAGLALLGAIQNSLSVAMSDDTQKEAALVTFLVTASGATFLGLGAAFWGLLLGLFTHAWLRPRETSRVARWVKRV